ncbi:MAG: hypothetical protein RR911_07600 [Oscillospiraceae bacterium]
MNSNTIYEFENGINFRLFIGFNDKETKTQLISTAQATELIENIAFKYFPRFSLTLSRGGYKNKSGNTFRENGAILDVISTNIETITNVADELEVALNQNSILIIAECVYYKFYSQLDTQGKIK